MDLAHSVMCATAMDRDEVSSLDSDSHNCQARIEGSALRWETICAGPIGQAPMSPNRVLQDIPFPVDETTKQCPRLGCVVLLANRGVAVARIMVLF